MRRLLSLVSALALGVQQLQPVQPAEPVQHVQPAEPVQHVQPAQPVQHVPGAVPGSVRARLHDRPHVHAGSGVHPRSRSGADGALRRRP
jgi:hypothetical protein